MAINYTKTNWVNGQAPAISATNLNKIEQGIKSACDGVDKVLPPTGSFVEQKTLLWENASPTSSFVEQTLPSSGSWDLGDYYEVEIVWNQVATLERYNTNKCPVGKGGFQCSYGSYYRAYTVHTNNIHFEHAFDAVGISDQNEIPVKIYGIKKVEVV